jgi:hypothetical protein
MDLLKSMSLPIVILLLVIACMIVGYLLWTSEQNKKATAGKIKAYILLENKILWKGLCDYCDTKVRAPWNKGSDKAKEEDRIQVFEVEGDQIWYDRWPDKGWFQQTVPCAFFHEREVCAVFPPAPCDCGHPECNGKRVPALTPSQLGLMEKEHVTEATLKATMWVKELFDKVGELMGKMPPAWLMWVGFAICIVGLIVVGILVYTRTGDIGWIRDYLAPAPETPAPPVAP